MSPLLKGIAACIVHLGVDMLVSFIFLLFLFLVLSLLFLCNFITSLDYWTVLCVEWQTEHLVYLSIGAYIQASHAELESEKA